MTASPSQTPKIVELYEHYLVDHDAKRFVAEVKQAYTVATLERLAEWGGRMARRGAVLALGYLADYGSNPVLGRALIDTDRGVRSLAESGIRNLWIRAGNDSQRQRLMKVNRLNASGRFDQAILLASELIEEAPDYAEAWNQRALAHFNQGQYEQAIRDCQHALEINPYHFSAATGIGKCYLQQGNQAAALEVFRRALRLNPGLEDVRAHVAYLQRVLKEQQ